MKTKIIDLIKKNRISSVELSDALGKKGIISGLKPLNPGHFIVGEVKYIYGHSCSNWSIHKQAEEVIDGGILFADSIECKEYALFGDIVSKYISLYKSFDGIVVNGLVRDAHQLRRNNYPIWCLGVTPLGCYNHEISETSKVTSIAEKNRARLDGCIMVADESGCAVIEKDFINEETINKLEFIELQEDIWYYCVDTLKWSTYETICLKKYLEVPEVLPELLRNKLNLQIPQK